MMQLEHLHISPGFWSIEEKSPIYALQHRALSFSYFFFKKYLFSFIATQQRKQSFHREQITAPKQSPAGQSESAKNVCRILLEMSLYN